MSEKITRKIIRVGQDVYFSADTNNPEGYELVATLYDPLERGGVPLFDQITEAIRPIFESEENLKDYE